MSSDTVDLARRGFLRGSILTREGRKRERSRCQPLGPTLPWFEGLDAETCGDCPQPCLEACGERVLQIHPQTHVLAATPWLDFTGSGCSFCGDCAEACPFVEEEPADSVRIGPVVIDYGACHAWNGVFCMSCIGRCDLKALFLDERRRVHLDSEACTGCGFCIAICPSNALGVFREVSSQTTDASSCL